MAKRRRGGGRGAEMFVNTYRGSITLAAAANAEVVEDIQTMMASGSPSPRKWVILAAGIQPVVDDTTSIGNLGSDLFEWQLALGEQTAFVEIDSKDNVGTARIDCALNTNGLQNLYWPCMLPIPYPMPAFNDHLTVAVRGINDAKWNDLEMNFTIWYITTPTAVPRELQEIAQAYGSISG